VLQLQRLYVHFHKPLDKRYIEPALHVIEALAVLFSAVSNHAHPLQGTQECGGECDERDQQRSTHKHRVSVCHRRTESDPHTGSVHKLLDQKGIEEKRKVPTLIHLRSMHLNRVKHIAMH
jgi:hypothetical protein